MDGSVRVCEYAKLSLGLGMSEVNTEHPLLLGRVSAGCATAQVHTPPDMPQACPAH